MTFERDIVILAESTFEETYAGLESQRRATGHTVRIVGFGCLCRAIGDGVVKIFDNLRHHQLARIAGVEESPVGGTEFMLIPGHIAETLHLLEIEVCAEETCHTGIFGYRSCVGTTVGAVEKTVDTTKLSPAPAARTGRGGSHAFLTAEHYVGKGLREIEVALLAFGLLVEQVIVQRVGEHLQVGGSLEIVRLRHAVLRGEVDGVLTRCEGQQSYRKT